MGVHSGKFGAVNGRDMVRNWTLEDTSTSQRVVHSGSRSGSFRLKGVLDWTGTYDAYHPAVADIANLPMPGEIFTFTGYTAPNDDQSGSTGTTYTGDAIVESIAITWDFTGGTPLYYVCNFSSGAGTGLTIDSAGAFFEDTAPALPQTICPLKVEVAPNSATPSFVEWDSVTTATLTLTSDIQTYINSSTDCNTGRKAGPYDWTLTLTEQEEDQEHGSIGDDVHLRLYTDATNYWLLELGHLESYTGLTVDRETGAIIEKTANLAMQGYDTAAADLGRISKPGVTTGTPWWGRDFTP